MSELLDDEQRSTDSHPLQTDQLDLVIALRQEQIAVLDQLISADPSNYAELLQKRYYFGVDLQKLLRDRSLRH